jgi:hypothetical protein
VFQNFFIDTETHLKVFRYIFVLRKHILLIPEHFEKCSGLYLCPIVDTGTLLKVFRFIFVPKIYFIQTGTLFKVYRFVFLPIFYWYRNTFKNVPVCIFAYILLIPEHFFQHFFQSVLVCILPIFYWYRNTFKSLPVCVFGYILLIP